MGRAVFIGNDGFLRDSGEAYDEPIRPEVLENALRSAIELIRKRTDASPRLYIDKSILGGPLSEEKIGFIIAGTGLECAYELCDFVDRELTRIESGCIATSDSKVIDACVCKPAVSIVDLPRAILGELFGARPLSLSKYIPFASSYPFFFRAR